MMSKQMNTASTTRLSFALVAVLGLSACDDDGGFSFPSGDAAQSGASGTETSIRAEGPASVEQDQERPDIFDVTDTGLWDGRPSLGGVWVAHPDVTDPERVIIRNKANGQSVVGALFRRPRDLPGPTIQVSSDAAEELGMLAGAVTQLNVIAMRRAEVEVEDAIPAPDLAVDAEAADLAQPSDIEATTLAPIAGAAAAIDAAEDAAEATAAPVAAATAQAATNVAAAATAAIQASEEPQDMIQIGIFSQQENADAAAAQLSGAKLSATVVSQESGGTTAWRVLARPQGDDDARKAALAQIKELGFVDAFFVAG